MEKIKKALNLKIILLLIALMFSFESVGYSVSDIGYNKTNLRVPIDTEQDRILGALKFSRRRLLVGGAVAVAGGAGLTGLGYNEFFVDRSFRPKDYYLLFDLPRIRPVWEPQPGLNDPSAQLIYALHAIQAQMVIKPIQEEGLRRTLHSLLVLLKKMPSEYTGEPEERKRERSIYFDFTISNANEILTLIQNTDPSKCIDFGVQWESYRFKRELLYLMSQVKDQLIMLHQRQLERAQQEFSNSKFKIPALSPVLEYLMHQVNLSYSSNGEFLTAAARVESQQKLDDGETKVIMWLDYMSDLTPTQGAFEEAREFYYACQHGPVRPIAFEDLEAVAFARRKLRPYVSYFTESGKAHHVAPDVLAAVALGNLMLKEQALTYPLMGAPLVIQESLGVDEKSVFVELYMNLWKKYFPHGPPSWSKKLSIQDRAADVIGGIFGGGSPTIGLMQTRAGPTKLEFTNNVQHNRLLSRVINTDSWSIRRINLYLLWARYSIETAAALYEGMIQEGISMQKDGQLNIVPKLDKLVATNWLADNWNPWGPDPIFAMLPLWERYPWPDWNLEAYFVNSNTDYISSWLRHMRVLVLESGVFDRPYRETSAREKIDTHIVGLTDASQINMLFKLAQGNNKYLKPAAIRSLQELSIHEGFPRRREAREWLERHGFWIPLSQMPVKGLVERPSSLQAAPVAVLLAEPTSQQQRISRRQFLTGGRDGQAQRLEWDNASSLPANSLTNLMLSHHNIADNSI